MTRIMTAIAATALLGSVFLPASASRAAQVTGAPTATVTAAPTPTDSAAEDQQLKPQECMDPRPTAAGAMSNLTKKLSETCGTIDPNRK